MLDTSEECIYNIVPDCYLAVVFVLPKITVYSDYEKVSNILCILFLNVIIPIKHAIIVIRLM